MEHDAESKTLRHERGTKSDTMAQAVFFSLRDLVVRPDAEEAPVYPGIHIPRLPNRGQQAIGIPVEAGERVPIPIGVRERVGIPVPIAVREEELNRLRIGTREDAMGGLPVKQREESMMRAVLKEFAVDKVTDEEEANWKNMREDDNFNQQKKDDEYARSIQAFMNEQSKESQIGFIDKALGWFGGSSAWEDEDPSSSSSSEYEQYALQAPCRCGGPGDG